MASTLVAMVSNLLAMASTLVAMASNLLAMASNLLAMLVAGGGGEWLIFLPNGCGWNMRHKSFKCGYPVLCVFTHYDWWIQ